jgi:hypothetical protein
MTEERHRVPLVAPAGTPGGGFWLTVPRAPVVESGPLVRAGARARPSTRFLVTAPRERDLGRGPLTGDRGHIFWRNGGALHGREPRPRVAAPCRAPSLKALRVAVRRGKACLDTAPLSDPPAGPAAPP